MHKMEWRYAKLHMSKGHCIGLCRDGSKEVSERLTETGQIIFNLV